MAQPARLKPTYRHPEARAYAAPGGPWDGPTLDRLLAHAAARALGPLLLDDAGAELDGGGVEGAAAALAGGLRAAGVRHGDVVAWQAPN